MVDARIRSLLPSFEPGARLLRTWPLAGGISAGMTAFEVERADGEFRKMILRQPNHPRSGGAGEEFRVLAALSGRLPVPTPRHLEADCFVVDYIEGRLDLRPDDVPAYLDRYAEGLARIHRTEFADLDLRPQGRGYSEPPAELNHSLREGEIRAALTHPKRPNPTVLRHGDLWPGNLLWRDGEIAGFLDWEEARVGEPLSDLSICRLDLLWILGWEAMEEFTRRYLSRMVLDPTDLPYWDLCAALRPITNIHEWSPAYPKLGRPDVTEATLRRDHGRFVAAALDRLL